mgnify:CR=1 FL=1
MFSRKGTLRNIVEHLEHYNASCGTLPIRAYLLVLGLTCALTRRYWRNWFQCVVCVVCVVTTGNYNTAVGYAARTTSLLHRLAATVVTGFNAQKKGDPKAAQMFKLSWLGAHTCQFLCLSAHQTGKL